MKKTKSRKRMVIPGIDSKARNLWNCLNRFKKKISRQIVQERYAKPCRKRKHGYAHEAGTGMPVWTLLRFLTYWI